MAQKTVAQLRADAAIAEERAQAAERELEEFKARVVEVAEEEAESRGWCDELGEVLERLGLEPSDVEYQATFKLTVRFKPARDARRPLREESEAGGALGFDFVRSCFTLSADADDDIDEIHDEDWEVESLERVGD